jgi:hypothetical protein
MAYGFGTTVNPQLGATNYSGFLQGALSGAQMQAQGGAAIGQGLASAGKSIGAGIAQGRERKDKMAERDRLLKEQKDTMVGRVKQGAAFAKAVGSLDLPEGVKSIFNTYSEEIANNPNISIAEQASAADAFLSQAPAIINLGLNEAKRQTDLRNNEFLRQAISLNTAADTGEVDIPSAAKTAVELGAAPDFVTQQLQGFEKLSPETFTPEIKTLTDPESGKKVQVVTTSRGGAQVIPETAGLRIPAEVVANDDRIKKLSEARKLYEAGKIGEALDIFIGLDVKNNFGQTPSIEDLAGFYKGISAPSNSGAPSPQAVGRFTVSPQP